MHRPPLPHPRCGEASGRSCLRSVGGSGSGLEQPRAVPGLWGQGQQGGGWGVDQPPGASRELLPTPHLAFLRSAVGVVPVCCRGGARSCGRLWGMESAETGG